MKIRIVLFLSCLLLEAALYAGDVPLDSLIQRIETRFEAYVDYDTFSVSVVSVTKQMDGKWQPIEEYYVEKKMTVKNKDGEEEIVKVIKKKKGEECDITEEVKEERRKAKEKAVKREKKKGEKQSADEEDGQNGEFSLDLDDIIPFGKGKRDLFEFYTWPDTLIADSSAYCIGVKVKEMSEQRYEGKYYFDKETYDLLMVDVTPSKNPKFVKEFSIKMWFDLMNAQYLIMTRDSMRIFAGFLIKKIRMEMNETYSDYRIGN